MKAYAINVLYALDLLLNALMGGERLQTISDRIADKDARGRTWAKVIGWIIDRFDPGHLARAQHPELGGMVLWRSSRALGLSALALLVGIVLARIYPCRAMTALWWAVVGSIGALAAVLGVGRLRAAL